MSERLDEVRRHRQQRSAHTDFVGALAQQREQRSRQDGARVQAGAQDRQRHLCDEVQDDEHRHGHEAHQGRRHVREARYLHCRVAVQVEQSRRHDEAGHDDVSIEYQQAGISGSWCR